jgi:predicted NUDIX family NTP pyrophosphohydrolase
VPKRSAGILLHRSTPEGGVDVLLVHPGGPFWAERDDAAWSIPKGEYTDEEDPYSVARREFCEELGIDPPDGEAVPLGEVRQSGGKRVVAWAVAGDLDCSSVTSNTFEMEWPPRSGRLQEFPEVDRAEWFPLDVARSKVHRGQIGLLDALAGRLGASGRP